ncbi:PP2C family protein-serine/threonine phosphatase [Nonomuraea sp. NPDC049714]|uniref:PP2C family protein-serine/threonine phosphatase n=1 Tax=Nonomuraea sp. NPDC049714 TaxID=3364357 RepID=UPI0037875706
MTFIVVTILASCLSAMAVHGRRRSWPPGLPATRPRLVAVGGTYEGSHGHPSDAYVIQERLIAAAAGVGGAELSQSAAALALGAVVAARPQHPGRREEDLTDCAEAAHQAVRTAAMSTPAMSGLASTLDLIILDPGERPCLRYAHVGDGAIWHCAKGAEPRLLTTAHRAGDGSPPHAAGPASGPAPQDGTRRQARTGPQVAVPQVAVPQVGTVPLRPGDRVVIVTDGVIRALGVPRLTALVAAGASPAVCLDRLYDEMAAVEPKDDATVIIADFVTV